MGIDEIDVRILQELQADNRISIRELSKRINLSSSSVTERVRRFEDHNITEGYTIRLNKKELGSGIDCIVQVTMEDRQYKKFKSFIQDDKHSEWCYRITGAACFIVKLPAPSLEDTEQLINAVPSYAQINTSIVFLKVEVNNRIDESLQIEFRAV